MKMKTTKLGVPHLKGKTEDMVRSMLDYESEWLWSIGDERHHAMAWLATINGEEFPLIVNWKAENGTEFEWGREPSWFEWDSVEITEIRPYF